MDQLRPRKPDGSDETRHVTAVCGGTYFPLDGEVTIASGNTKEEGVKVDEVVWEKDGVVWAWGCLDELQDILGEGLLDSIRRVGRQDAHKWG